MVRTATNADLILEIDGGIKKEVSVGCSIGKKVCSICGADRQEATCGHQPAKSTAAGCATPCWRTPPTPMNGALWRCRPNRPPG